jgi:hypothetical protein
LRVLRAFDADDRELLARDDAAPVERVVLLAAVLFRAVLLAAVLLAAVLLAAVRDEVLLGITAERTLPNSFIALLLAFSASRLSVASLFVTSL